MSACAVIRLAALLPACLSSTATLAQESLSWHGFANVGTYYSGEDGFLNDESGYSFPLMDVGLGGSWQATPSLRASAQILYRQAGESSRDDVFLDYGFIDWQAYQQPTMVAGLRLGRVKNIYGLYNDVRDVASLRPSIFLPDPIYKEKFRDFYHTSDAVSAYLYHSSSLATVSLDLSAGQLNISNQAALELLPPDTPGQLKDESSVIGRLLVDTFQGGLRLAYSYANLSYDFEPAPASQQTYPGDTEFLFRTLSAEAYLGNWTLTAEKTNSKVTLNGVRHPDMHSTTHPTGYYISAAWNINYTWKWFIRYEDYDQDSGKLNPEANDNHSQFSNSRVTGLCFRGNGNWQISAEYHRIHGTTWLSATDETHSASHGPWNLFAAQLQIWF